MHKFYVRVFYKDSGSADFTLNAFSFEQARELAGMMINENRVSCRFDGTFEIFGIERADGSVETYNESVRFHANNS